MVSQKVRSPIGVEDKFRGSDGLGDFLRDTQKIAKRLTVNPEPLNRERLRIKVNDHMKGNIIFRLSWRNVWRNKRRTVLTLLTVLVGCAMIILTNAIAKGGHNQMIEDAVALNTGHVQIHEKGFWDNKTIDYAFRPEKTLFEILEHDQDIAAFSPRIHTGVLVSFKDSSRGAIMQGVDPEKEVLVTDLHTKVLPGGRYLKAGDTTQVVMGSMLARHLGATVGDTVAILSQGFDGSIAAEYLTIVGLFKSGNQEYDRALMLMPLDQADKTFSMMGYINSICIRLKGPDSVNHVVSTLKKATDHYPTKLEVMGWEKLMPELVQFIVMDNMGAYIFDFILFLVVAFGILNTIQMSVFERTREFGVMLSIGTRPGQISAIVLTETFFVTLLGMLFGTAIGSGLSFYFHMIPLDFSKYSSEMAVWGVATTIYPAKLTWLNITVTNALIFLLSMLFCLFPARKAARLKPIEAIRRL